jgi:hypothetical protein
MNSNVSVESETQTIASSITRMDSCSNSVSSVSSIESIADKSKNDKHHRTSIYDDTIEAEIIRKKATHQLLWKKTRTISIDSQEITPRVTKPIEKIPVRKRDIHEPVHRRDTPTLSGFETIMNKNDVH